MEKIFFNFYSEIVEVQSDWSEILNFLKKDFSYFTTAPQLVSSKSLKIAIFKGNPLSLRIPEVTSRLQSLNSITYQVGDIRYNDYYGKLLSIFNYKTESCEIYSENLDKTHEIAYLLILSRVGKRLDLNGLHKLHAFAISFRGTAFVCMMPMKGGKSTLLIELLKNPEVKMISDDIPMITSLGVIVPFPIKIGIDEGRESELEVINPKENIYCLNREQYGKKIFVSLDGVKNKIETKSFKRIVLAEGFRFHSENTIIKKAHWFKTFYGLFKHGVIGFGLPMILEYFWEFGFKDFLIKTRIFFQRLIAFGFLSIRAKRVTILFGTDRQKNAKAILEMLEG